MSGRLTDPWFAAGFLWDATDSGSFKTDFDHQRFDRPKGRPTLAGAQGLVLWCPCGYGKPEYPLDGGRPHAIEIPFANPQGVVVVPANFGPTDRSGNKPRWSVSGTSLDDLTISPSVDVNAPSCWHGFITNGEVTTC